MSRIIAVLCLLPFVCIGNDWIDDPSAIPLPRDGAYPVERYRVRADFNGDGIEDMALSCSTRQFGNAGVTFIVYIRNAEGKYRELGEFFGHPLAIALEKIDKKVRLWTYVRNGGWTGEIGYVEVREDGLSGYHHITIYPGDSGTKMGNAIYQVVMKNSDPPITVEKSLTENGKVKWTDPD